MAIRAFLSFILSLGRAQTKTCPEKWTEFNGHCYMIGNVLDVQSKVKLTEIFMKTI